MCCTARAHCHDTDDIDDGRMTETIADSIDDTPRIAAQLADELDEVRLVRLEQKDCGRTLHSMWSASDAPR